MKKPRERKRGKNKALTVWAIQKGAQSGHLTMTRKRMVMVLEWICRPRESFHEYEQEQEIFAWATQAGPDWIPVIINFLQFPPQESEGYEGQSIILWDRAITFMSLFVAQKFSDKTFSTFRDTFLSDSLHFADQIKALGNIKNEHAWPMLLEIVNLADNLTSSQIDALADSIRSLARLEVAPLNDASKVLERLLENATVRNDPHLQQNITAEMREVEFRKRPKAWEIEAGLKSGELTMTRDYMITVLEYLHRYPSLFTELSELDEDMYHWGTISTPDWIPILIDLQLFPPQDLEFLEARWIGYSPQLFGGVASKFPEQCFAAVSEAIKSSGTCPPILIDALGYVDTQAAWDLLVEMSLTIEEMTTEQARELMYSIGALSLSDIAPVSEAIQVLEHLSKASPVQTDSTLLKEITKDIQELYKKRDASV
jgi:hypothetical protein